jgi:hypothetical protein
MGRPALIVGESSSVSQPLAPIDNVSGGQVGQCSKSPIGLSRFAQLQGQKQKIAYVVNIRGTPMPAIRKLASYRSCPVCVCV